MHEIHTPRLFVLQGSLLYLQKSGPSKSSAIADTPFKWSLLSFTGGLATTLGLQVDCKAWNIPGWEKRLRRRLWWLVFCEEKWRGLIQGRLAVLRDDQWDVTCLTVEDFAVEATDPTSPAGVNKVLVTETGRQFKALSDLALLVDDEYQTF